MGKKKLTKKNARKVCERIATFIETQGAAGKELAIRLNATLEQVADDDLFGTEGQLDPRGDQRD